MKIVKIALTGGPCAGKTTMLKAIKKYLNKEGIPNIIVPETATELILNGILPNGTEKNNLFFQDLVLQSQLFKENRAEVYANAEYGELDKVVIIYDRGIIDGKAYLDSFEKILRNNNVTEIESLDKYDLVLDLITTADCNKKVYNNLNEARFENIEEAINVDRKTSNAWAGHRNLKIINTSITLKEEVDIILKHISDLLQNRETKKIDNYLVDLSDFVPEKETTNILTTDYYLNVNSNGYDYILRKRNYKNKLSYVFIVQKNDKKKITTISSKTVLEKSFSELLEKYNVIKERNYEEISFVQNRQLYRFEIYNGISVMRIEKNKLNDNFVLPSGVNVLKYDVTDKEVNALLEEQTSMIYKRK